MDIIKARTRPSNRMPETWFTGAVWQDPINDPPAPGRARSVLVTFAPGARTNWHTHPLGQTLFIVSGVGRVQVEGGPVREVLPGDTIWFPPGERHWHGASPDRMLVHLAIHEHVDGSHVDWQEPVADADYAAAPLPD